MKTRNYLNIFAIGAAAMMVLGGCAKEIENYENIEKPGAEDNAPVAAVVSAGIESADTKTYMGDAEEVDGKKVRKVYWENGDQISINGTTSTALAEVGENATSAEFGFTTAPETPYKAVYPASIWSKVEGDNTLVSLPKEYASAAHASKASFAQNALPMAAYSAEGGDLTFKHLCAVLKLSLTGDKTIDYVEFRGNNGEKVSSTMYLTCTEDGVELSYNAVEDYQKVVKVQVDKTLPTDIYIAVPVTYQKDAGKATAGVFSKGFTVTVVDTEGALMTKSVTESRTFTPGKLINMPVLAYAPTEDGSAKLPWKIDTAEEWLAYIAKMKVADSEDRYILTSDIDLSGSENGATADPFYGYLDGKGYTVKVNINDSGNNVGLIGQNYGEIQNLKVTGNITGDSEGSHVGVVGRNRNTVKNVTFAGKLRSSGGAGAGESVGGICGRNDEGALISGCEVTNPNISIRMKGVGGVCGNNYGTIENCRVATATESTGIVNDVSDLGGICGVNRPGATLKGCVVDNAKVQGDSKIGGICGSNGGIIYDCAVLSGSVTAKNLYVGGIAGNNNGFVVNCYSWIGSVTSTDKADIGGICGYLDANGAVINSYSTCPLLTIAPSGYSSARKGYAIGQIAVGNIQNVYATKDNVLGRKITKNYVDGFFSESEWSALVTEENMQSGAVTVPSSGKECASFVEALNEGVAIYNAWTHDSKPKGLTLKSWAASDTYPVFAE